VRQTPVTVGTCTLLSFSNTFNLSR
jgi:hypothetical protein